MAVVFISPKQRQKMFFTVITAGFAAFVLIVMLFVLLSKPKEVPQTVVFNKPKVAINMDILDSEQFKNLLPMDKMDIQFRYRAVKKDNATVEGYISAPSQAEAEQTLTALKYTILELKEVEIGRENPFTPYFNTVLPSPGSGGSRRTTR